MTKIYVLGGTGYAGSSITKEALKRGHNVTVISRSQPKEKIHGAQYIHGDISKSVSIPGDVDVVIGALSPRGDNAGKLKSIYNKLLLQARESKSRLVLVGGFSCLRRKKGEARLIEEEAGAFPTDTPVEIIAEARENLDVLNDFIENGTDIDWLVVSPALQFSAWTPGEDLGHYRIGDDVALFDSNGVSAISGIDYARAILDEIDNPTYHRTQIGVAY